MKAYCDKDKIIELLDGRKIKWLVEKLNELGIRIEVNTFSNLLNNRAEWKLTYALGIAKILNTNVEKIFELNEKIH